MENSAEMLEICYNMVEISRKLKLNDSPKSFQNQPSSAKQYDQLEPLDGCSNAVGKVGQCQWADRKEKLGGKVGKWQESRFEQPQSDTSLQNL